MTISETKLMVQSAADARELKVKIQETGQVFSSMSQVARFFAVDRSTVFYKIQRQGANTRKLPNVHFLYAQEDEEVTDIMPRYLSSVPEVRRMIMTSNARVYLTYDEIDKAFFLLEELVFTMVGQAVAMRADLVVRKFDRGVMFKWTSRSAT